MKHLNQYKNESFNLKALPSYKNENFNMKPMATYITEYIIKKKLDEPIDSEYHYHYDYYPETKKELIKNIKELVKKGISDFNCINTSNITDMSELFKIGIFTKMSFDVSNWDVSNVTNMTNMFKNCTSLKNKQSWYKE